MQWAEPFGLGELGLMPSEFWSLTVREFWIKHAAFRRAEDRARALGVELATMTTSYKPKDRAEMQRIANRLRRYPVKPWLQSR